ncbi:MAG TPA: penicillin-binding protein 2 [Acidimicrobiales bacterium]|jgi:penicillin-binding protein 2
MDSPRLRLGVLGVVVISLFAALLARLWYLQVLAAPELRVEAQRNSVRLVESEGTRGRILDRKGRVLVGNRVSNAVVVSRQAADKKPEILSRLAPVLGVPEAELGKRIHDSRFSPFKPVPLAEDVPKEKLIYIREHQADFPGVDGVQLARRDYPEGVLGAQLLGYVAEINEKELAAHKDRGYKQGDTIGKAGVESAYEADLRGAPQIEKLEVDSKGKVLRSLGIQPAVAGHDVQLTIDLDAQRLAEDSLVQGLLTARQSYDRDSGTRFLAPAGSAVVTDPRDGSVVAMASYPTYDPREFIDGISQDRFAQLQDPAGSFPLNNRVTQGQYAPGSTFKLVSGMTALSTGLIKPQDTVDDAGFIKVGNPPRIFRNAFGQVNGRVNVSEALTKSSDVFFYQVGANLWDEKNRTRYGPTAIQDTARSLGMGSPTHIELPFEAGGRVPDPDSRKRLHASNPEAFPTADWFTGDNINLAVGQGDLVVTPLQLVNAYATFANGGTVWAPRVASVILDENHTPVRSVDAREVRKVDLPPGVRAPIMQGLTGVVADSKGTAAPAFSGFPLTGYPIAGKTGTAQVSGKQDTSLFCAFGPAQAPEHAVSVIMEQSGFGAEAAAPVARRIFDGLTGGATKPVERVSAVD